MAGGASRPPGRLLLAMLMFGIPAIYFITRLLPHDIESTGSLIHHRADNPLEPTFAHVTSYNDSSCDASHPCPADQCCGITGYCGYGPEHCGEGCLSNCQATAECGEFASPPGKPCSSNMCCSKAGFCGNSTDHCSTMCQSDCVEDPEPSTPDSKQDIHPRGQNISIKALTQAWSGENGQQCRLDDKCQDTNYMGCLPGEVVAGWDGHECDSPDVLISHGLAICCPIDEYPRSCIWRGGASGTDDCKGYCVEGELALFQSRWGGGFNSEDGGTAYCDHNRKVFCCKADHWNDLIKQCEWTKCDGICPAGKASVGARYAGQECENEPHQKQFCCPENKFDSCGWAGSGDCEDNACGDGMIQVTEDAFGDTEFDWCSDDKKKALCCSLPAGPRWLPADIDHLFEEPVPPTNDFHYHLDFLDDGDPPVPGDISAASAFALLVVEGPSSAVTSAVTKRDGSISDLKFLDCRISDGPEYSKARFVCLADDREHDCHDMLEGGIEGTIIEMPKGCGNDKYGVARGLDVSKDQTLPFQLSNIQNKTVMELSFDYKFTQSKIDQGDIFFSLDISNMPGYWTNIVDGHPLTDASFAEWWAFALRQLDVQDVGNGTSVSLDLSRNLYEDVVDCPDGSKSYAHINTRGWATAQVKFAIRLYGKIGSTLELLEVLEFTDVNIEANSYFNMWLDGNFLMNTTIRTLAAEPFQQFRHRGLMTVGPRFQADIGIVSSANMQINYSLGTHAKTTENMVQGWPGSVVLPSGQVELDPYQPVFGGGVGASREPGAINVVTEVRMIYPIEVDDFGTEVKRIVAEPESKFQTWHYLDTDKDGLYNVTLGATEGIGNLTYPFDSPDRFPEWTDDEGHPRAMGSRTTPFSVAFGRAGSAPDPNDPSGPGDEPIESDDNALFAGAAVFACGAPLSQSCPDFPTSCTFSICEADPGYCDDEDSVDDPDTDLFEIKGGARGYKVTFSDKSTMSIRSQPHPSIGDLFDGVGVDQVLYKAFGYEQPAECGIANVFDSQINEAMVDDLSQYYVTEHIMELQTISQFLRSAESGELPSGNPTSVKISSSFFREFWNQNFLKADLEPVFPDGEYISPTSPNDRVFEALGSNLNRENFVVADKEINGVKARVWKHNDIRADGGFNTDVYNWIYNCGDAAKFMKYLKAAIAVFNYISGENDVYSRYANSIKLVERQMILIEEYTNDRGGSGLAHAWREYIMDFNLNIALETRGWVQSKIDYVFREYEKAPELVKARIPHRDKTLSDIVYLLQQANAIVLRNNF